ncbi:MAG TPA: nuclear transport factor 2 family protein, partial [Dongiaceae bacterium]|nr:nuclear transport factor 2 family protein [Dongiaceae bacterium]
LGAAFVFMSAVILGLPSLVDAAGPSESDEIRQRVFDYARSVDAADSTLAAQLWLDSPDVSFIHPLGHEHGFKQIQQNVYQKLMGETFSERKLSPHDISVHIFRNCAWVEFYWDFSAKFRKDGSAVTTHGRETQVYWKTKQGWRLVHVHYSGMPATD